MWFFFDFFGFEHDKNLLIYIELSQKLSNLKIKYSTSPHNLFFRVRKNLNFWGDRQIIETYYDFRKLKLFQLIF